MTVIALSMRVGLRLSLNYETLEYYTENELMCIRLLKETEIATGLSIITSGLVFGAGFLLCFFELLHFILAVIILVIMN